MASKEIPIVAFKSPIAMEKWLAKNFSKSEGLWLQLQKKSSKTRSVTYAEALDIALCYGWIDGQKKPFDELSWLQKFTPRRPRSAWSLRNTEHVRRLTREGRMKSAGLAAVASAKKSGRWKDAYEAQGTANVPEDFVEALKMDKKAKSFFESLNRTNVYSIIYRLQTAKKPETRARRLEQILKMMKEGKKFHP